MAELIICNDVTADTPTTVDYYFIFMLFKHLCVYDNEFVLFLKYWMSRSSFNQNKETKVSLFSWFVIFFN